MATGSASRVMEGPRPELPTIVHMRWGQSETAAEEFLCSSPAGTGVGPGFSHPCAFSLMRSFLSTLSSISDSAFCSQKVGTYLSSVTLQLSCKALFVYVPLR
jgi:hypothetical protein